MIWDLPPSHRALLLALPTAIAALSAAAQEQPPNPATAPGVLDPKLASITQPGTPDPAPTPSLDAPIDESLLERPEAVVWLKDGGRASGLLIERTETHVTLGAGEVRTTFTADQYSRVEVLPTILERYLSQRSLIDDHSLEQRVDLARWVYSKGRLDLALRELDGVLTIDPAFAPAKELRDLAKLQQRLDRESKARKKERDAIGKVPAPPVPPIAAPRPDPVPLLTPEQINILKVYEIDLADPPRLAVEQATITELLRKYADNPLIPLTQEGRESLYRRSPVEILELMFQLRAREFYGQVTVRDQPRSMQLFRDQVHRTWLLNRCATAGCHGGGGGGGTDAGSFRLATNAPNSEATFYTNFLIIDRFKTKDGKRLLNADDPARSPLLHLGLRRELSLMPHPVVPVRDGKGDRWQPVFLDADDRPFLQSVDWILSLNRPRAEYPIEYPPPPPLPPPVASPDNAQAPAQRPPSPR